VSVRADPGSNLPADPTDPASAADPTDPTDPTDPASATDPTDPTDSADTASTATPTPARPRRRQPKTIERFDTVERIVHWVTAVLMLELLATGTILYIPSIALAVGHRGIIETLHVYSGLGLLVPLIVGVLGPWRGRLLADLRRFDRWTKADWDWFHLPQHRAGVPRGKFNGGQKAEAAFVGAGMVVMLVTGTLMRFAPASWINWQQGATLVHDVGFIAIGVGVAGHIYYALSRPEQLKAMLSGKILRSWATKNAPAWVEEVDEDKP
jgi:formate dehydrogenase subunit gamma